MQPSRNPVGFSQVQLACTMARGARPSRRSRQRRMLTSGRLRRHSRPRDEGNLRAVLRCGGPRRRRSHGTLRDGRCRQPELRLRGMGRDRESGPRDLSCPADLQGRLHLLGRCDLHFADGGERVRAFVLVRRAHPGRLSSHRPQRDLHGVRRRLRVVHRREHGRRHVDGTDGRCRGGARRGCMRHPGGRGQWSGVRVGCPRFGQHDRELSGGTGRGLLYPLLACADDEACAQVVACVNACPTPRANGCVDTCSSSASSAAQDQLSALASCSKDAMIPCQWP